MTAKTIVDQSTLRQARIFYGLLPRQLPLALYIPLDFSTAGSNGLDIAIDIELLKQGADFEQVASVFIDNSQSGQTFTLKCANSQFWLPVGAGRCGFFPCLAAQDEKFTGSISGVAGGLVKLQFLNITVPLGVW